MGLRTGRLMDDEVLERAWKFFSFFARIKKRGDANSETQKALFTGISSNVTLFTERVDLIREENVPLVFVKSVIEGIQSCMEVG